MPLTNTPAPSRARLEHEPKSRSRSLPGFERTSTARAVPVPAAQRRCPTFISTPFDDTSLAFALPLLKTTSWWTTGALASAAAVRATAPPAAHARDQRLL